MFGIYVLSPLRSSFLKPNLMNTWNILESDEILEMGYHGNQKFIVKFSQNGQVPQEDFMKYP
jgi:hypothetical protein